MYFYIWHSNCDNNYIILNVIKKPNQKIVMTTISKLFFISLLFILPYNYVAAQGNSPTDVLQGINFDETESAIKDIDISSYINDITSELEALDEKYTSDSLEKYEKYLNFRMEKVQQLVNKPAGDCMDKYDLIAYKGQIFSEISLKGLNPLVLDLRAMLKAKKDAKKVIYDKMVADASIKFEEAIKAKETAVNLKMAQTMVKAREDSIYYALSQQAIKEQQNISVLAALETQNNLKIRNSLEPVEAAKAGRGVLCFKIQIKKEPDPVPVVPVSTEENTESTGDESNTNLNSNSGDGTIQETPIEYDENGNPK